MKIGGCDGSSIVPFGREYVELTPLPDDRSLMRAVWHGALTELPFAFFYKKTEQGWKLDLADDGRGHEPEGAEEVARLRALRRLGEGTERLAEETERGRFATVGELIRELDALDARLPELR